MSLAFLTGCCETTTAGIVQQLKINLFSNLIPKPYPTLLECVNLNQILFYYGAD